MRPSLGMCVVTSRRNRGARRRVGVGPGAGEGEGEGEGIEVGALMNESDMSVAGVVGRYEVDEAPGGRSDEDELERSSCCCSGVGGARLEIVGTGASASAAPAAGAGGASTSISPAASCSSAASTASSSARYASTYCTSSSPRFETRAYWRAMARWMAALLVASSAESERMKGRPNSSPDERMPYLDVDDDAAGGCLTWTSGTRTGAVGS